MPMLLRIMMQAGRVRPKQLFPVTVATENAAKITFSISAETVFTHLEQLKQKLKVYASTEFYLTH